MKLRIQDIVAASYKNDMLDETRVNRIVPRLNRKELKAYIHGLKNHEKKTTVQVEVANPASLDEETLQKIFGNKKIQTRVNPELLLGLRITANDDVYNLNMKTNLERIVDYAAE